MGPDEFVLVMVKVVKLSSGEIQFTVKQTNMSQQPPPQGGQLFHGSEEWLQPPASGGEALSPPSSTYGENRDFRAERAAETRSERPSPEGRQYVEERNPTYQMGQVRAPVPGESSPTVAYLPRGEVTSRSAAAPPRFPPPPFPLGGEQARGREPTPETQTDMGAGGTQMPINVSAGGQMPGKHQQQEPDQTNWWDDADAADFDLTAPDLDAMTKSQLARYLLGAGIPQDEADHVYREGWTGRQWATVLDPSLDGPAIKAVWEIIGVSGGAKRLRLMADIKETHERRGARAATRQGKKSRDGSPERKEQAGAECRRARIEHAPKIPTGMHQPMDGNGDKFQIYCKTLQTWLAPYSEALRYGIKAAAQGASESHLAEMVEAFTPSDRELDLRLMSFLLSTSTTEMQGRLYDDSTRSINGQMTTVKVIAHILTIVEYASADTKARALQNWLSKEPIKDASTLVDQLEVFTREVGTLHRLNLMAPDDPAANSLQCAALSRMIEKLINDPLRSGDLAVPVCWAMRTYPNDAGKLLEELKNCAKAIQSKMAIGKKPIAREFQRTRQNQWASSGTSNAAVPSEVICFEYREQNKCKFTDGKCRFKHTGRSGNVCTDSTYTKTGKCSAFTKCTDCHPWVESKFGKLADAKFEDSAAGTGGSLKRAVIAVVGHSFSAAPMNITRTADWEGDADWEEGDTESDDGEVDFDMTVPVIADGHVPLGTAVLAPISEVLGEHRSNRGERRPDLLMEAAIQMQLRDVPLDEMDAALIDSDLSLDRSLTDSPDEGAPPETDTEPGSSLRTDDDWNMEDGSYQTESVATSESIVSDADECDWRATLSEHGWVPERIDEWLAEQAAVAGALKKRRVGNWAADDTGLIDCESGSRPDSMLLLDSGTFKHMSGVNSSHLAINVRKVKEYPVGTAGGIIWLDQGCDIVGKRHVFRGCLVNPHLENSLLSEGWLRLEGWKFESTATGKLITDPQGNLEMAYTKGVLDYLPASMVPNREETRLAVEFQSKCAVSCQPTQEQMMDMSNDEACMAWHYFSGTATHQADQCQCRSGCIVETVLGKTFCDDFREWPSPLRPA